MRNTHQHIYVLMGPLRGALLRVAPRYTVGRGPRALLAAARRQPPNVYMCWVLRVPGHDLLYSPADAATSMTVGVNAGPCTSRGPYSAAAADDADSA